LRRSLALAQSRRPRCAPLLAFLVDVQPTFAPRETFSKTFDSCKFTKTCCKFAFKFTISREIAKLRANLQSLQANLQTKIPFNGDIYCKFDCKFFGCQRKAHNLRSREKGVEVSFGDDEVGSCEMQDDSWSPSKGQETQLQLRGGPTPHNDAPGLLAGIGAAAPQRREQKTCFAASRLFFIYHLPSWRTLPCYFEPPSKNYMLHLNLKITRQRS
jgi:hypothetical protein